MRKLKLGTEILLFLTVFSTYAKTPFSVKIENQSFYTVHSLPSFRNEVRDGANSYTVKVLEASDITQEYFTFNEDVVVRNFRTNVEKNLSDFINFESVSIEDNELFVDVVDNSKIPRFLKIPLFVVPEYYTELNVKLIKPLIIGEAEYTVKSEFTGNGKILYYMEPLYINEEVAQKYSLMEKDYTTEERKEKKLPETALIREKITTFKDKGKSFIYTSNIVDLFIK